MLRTARSIAAAGRSLLSLFAFIRLIVMKEHHPPRNAIPHTTILRPDRQPGRLRRSGRILPGCESVEPSDMEVLSEGTNNARVCAGLAVACSGYAKAERGEPRTIRVLCT